jgi:hypothetical protein
MAKGLEVTAPKTTGLKATGLKLRGLIAKGKYGRSLQNLMAT